MAQGRTGHFLLASVIMEPEMAQVALELPPERLALSPRVELEAAAPVPDSPPAPAAAPARENVCQPGASAQPAETIRVRVNLIDQLINLAGELVLGAQPAGAHAARRRPARPRAGADDT